MAAVLALVVLAFNAPAFAAGKIPPEPPANRVPVTICHDVNGNGNTGNGYNKITVDASSIVQAGHLNHEGDIIPPFTYFTLEGTGQNRFWEEHSFPGQGDASMIANDCGSSGEPQGFCPEGTDHEGEEIPPGETAETFCNDEVPPTCPAGTDHEGQQIPEGETAETFCDDGEGPPDNPGTTPNNNPPAGPTVLGEQASTGGQGTAGGVAGSQGAVSPNAPAVPTAVDAGLAPASTGSGEALLARGLVGFGFVLLVCAGLLGLRDRKRGANLA